MSQSSRDPESGDPRDDDLPLFRDAFARRTDPDTSKKAAAKVDVTAKEAAYMEALHRLGGEATTKEIAAESGVHPWSISPRSAPLCRKGLIEDSGKRREGCIVWRALQEPPETNTRIP